ncbi:hypothetical protein B566_EDAN008557, partial [Ephemera danica]
MLILMLFALLVAGSECSIPRWGRKSAEYAVKHESRAGEYILPTNLEPLEYDISINPYLEFPPENAFTFDGHVHVLFTVTADTTIVRLHAFNLTIDDATFKVQADNETEARNISSWGLSSDDKHFLSIYMTQALEAGRLFTLDVDFSGWMKDDLVGFYRSSYFNDTGNTNENRPELQQFVYEEMFASLLSDAFETTHPVIDTVENPAGPTATFDGLAYTK